MKGKVNNAKKKEHKRIRHQSHDKEVKNLGEMRNVNQLATEAEMTAHIGDMKTLQTDRQILYFLNNEITAYIMMKIHLNIFTE